MISTASTAFYICDDFGFELDTLTVLISLVVCLERPLLYYILHNMTKRVIISLYLFTHKTIDVQNHTTLHCDSTMCNLSMYLYCKLYGLNGFSVNETLHRLPFKYKTCHTKYIDNLNGGSATRCVRRYSLPIQIVVAFS